MAVLRHMADADDGASALRVASAQAAMLAVDAGFRRRSAGACRRAPRAARTGRCRRRRRRRGSRLRASAKETSSTRMTPRSSRTTRLRASSATCAGMGGALVDLQDHLAADHRVGEFRRRGLGGIEGRDHLAAPHHRDAVGQAHDLAQLVGDEDDRLVLAACSTRSISNSWSASAGVSTAVGSSSTRISAPRTSAFRISTRCCRPTDNSPTIASGSTSRPYSRAELARARLRIKPRAFGEQRAALGAEHDVFEHAERRHQHEMLMHHADAVADRLARRADATGSPLMRISPESAS